MRVAVQSCWMGNAWGMAWHGMAFPHYDEEGSTSGSEIFPEYASAHKRITVGPKGRKGQRMVEGSFSSAFVKDKTRRRQGGEEEQEDHGSPPCLHRLRGAKVVG